MLGCTAVGFMKNSKAADRVFCLKFQKYRFKVLSIAV